jgi:hypothetical protein
MALSVVVLVGEAQKWIPELVAKAKTLKVRAAPKPAPMWARWSAAPPCRASKA